MSNIKMNYVVLFILFFTCLFLAFGYPFLLGQPDSGLAAAACVFGIIGAIVVLAKLFALINYSSREDKKVKSDKKKDEAKE